MAEALEMACPECDLMVALDPLEPGQRANCPRCGQLLTAFESDATSRALAYAVAAAILLVLANSFPFLQLRSSGLETTMTIPGASAELYRDGYGVLAGMVLAPIVLLPGSILVAAIGLLLPLRVGRKVPWLVPAARMVFGLNPWSMAEVFIIGVLVSLVKIGEVATVVIGVSFWAYVGFVLCFLAALRSVDRFQLWRAIEHRLA